MRCSYIIIPLKPRSNPELAWRILTPFTEREPEMGYLELRASKHRRQDWTSGLLNSGLGSATVIPRGRRCGSGSHWLLKGSRTTVTLPCWDHGDTFFTKWCAFLFPHVTTVRHCCLKATHTTHCALTWPQCLCRNCKESKIYQKVNQLM